MSNDTVVSLFVDTNCFLHLRDLKDLPWRDVFKDAARIDIQVAACVISELDKFKSSQRDRQRKRSRAALRAIEEASENDGFYTVLRESPIEIRLSVADVESFDWKAFPKLDSAKPDDQLIGDAISHGNGAIVFSHDTGPRIMARRHGLVALGPPDEWLLPPEATVEQIRIKALEREVEQAQSNSVVIEASIDDQKTEQGYIEYLTPILPALDARTIDALVERVVSDEPRHEIKVTESPTNSSLFRHSYMFSNGYTQATRDRYDAEYDKFVDYVREYFSNLHEALRPLYIAHPVSYTVKNSGNVSAEGLRVQTEVIGDATLHVESNSGFNFGSANCRPLQTNRRRTMHTIWTIHCVRRLRRLLHLVIRLGSIGSSARSMVRERALCSARILGRRENMRTRYGFF